MTWICEPGSLPSSAQCDSSLPLPAKRSDSSCYIYPLITGLSVDFHFHSTEDTNSLSCFFHYYRIFHHLFHWNLYILHFHKPILFPLLHLSYLLCHLLHFDLFPPHRSMTPSSFILSLSFSGALQLQANHVTERPQLCAAIPRKISTPSKHIAYMESWSRAYEDIKRTCTHMTAKNTLQPSSSVPKNNWTVRTTPTWKEEKDYQKIIQIHRWTQVFH